MSAKDQAEETRSLSFTQDEFDRIIQDRLARDRQSRAQVVHEPRVYALDSPHSFFGDVLNAQLSGAGGEQHRAQQRLAQYARELAHEAVRGSVEGRRAERIITQADRHRHDHEQRSEHRLREFRALSSGGGSTASASGGGGAAFVTPIFINDAWAPFRGINRAFADQCHTLPLAPYGMEAYIPAFTGAAGAAQQTEGSAVTETDPTTGLQGSPVVTITGQITLSQQLHDRGYSGGGSLDAVIGRQVSEQLEQSVDAYVLSTVITNSSSFAGAASLTANSWKEVYSDLAKAREGITDTAGVRLRPTHFFTTSDLYGGLTNIMGSDGRPMVLPVSLPGFPIIQGADGDLEDGPTPKWARFTGTVLPGNVLWFTDDNIPASGSNNQLIVSAADQSVVLLESPDPVLTVFPQTVAGNLQTILNLRSYVCVITRHASGTQVYTGAGYPTTLK